MEEERPPSKLSAKEVLAGIIVGISVVLSLDTAVLLAWIVSRAMGTDGGATWTFIASLGIWQWLYLVPLLALAHRHLERSLSTGITIGIITSGALVSLVITACGAHILGF